MSSLYQHTDERPYSVSVGAVLVNGEGKICAHHAPREAFPQDVQDAVSAPELYYLMRESLEDGETLEEAVYRGLKEEFGMTGSVVGYLGAISGRAMSYRGPFEKTTLYFEVSLESIGERIPDEESFTELVWCDPAELLTHMHAQKSALRDDTDESKILERYMGRYKAHG